MTESLLWRGRRAGWYMLIPDDEQRVAWEQGVRGPLPAEVRITITQDWLLDFETTIPKAVADLVAAHGDPR